MSSKTEWLQDIIDKQETQSSNAIQQDEQIGDSLQKSAKQKPKFIRNVIWSFKYDRGGVFASIGFMILTCIGALSTYGHTVLPIGFSIIYAILAVFSCIRSIFADEIDHGIPTQIYLFMLCIMTEMICVGLWFITQ